MSPPVYNNIQHEGIENSCANGSFINPPVHVRWHTKEKLHSSSKTVYEMYIINSIINYNNVYIFIEICVDCVYTYCT